MASSATRITLAHPELLDRDTRDLMAWIQAHPDKMKLDFVGSADQSLSLIHI